MTDWNKVAETLRWKYKNFDGSNQENLDAAIRLVTLAAALPEGEAERMLKAAISNRADDEYRRQLQARRDLHANTKLRSEEKP